MYTDSFNSHSVIATAACLAVSQPNTLRGVEQPQTHHFLITTTAAGLHEVFLLV
jgi:hypothetical protein